MEHLLAAWTKVVEQLRDASRILLLSDYDGTLAPIVERPELASLPENIRRLLEALARQRRVTVGIISGRALGDLMSKVNIGGIIYAGNHGLEIQGPGVSFINPLAAEIAPVLRIIRYLLSRALRRTSGAIVEDKGLTLSVHYRLVDEEREGEVKDAVEQVVGGAQALGKVKITTGKKVYEVRPVVTWDKGKAVKLLMKKYGKGGRKSRLLPVYLGDDRTDEDAFAVVAKYGNGVSVFVGDPEQETSARYFLTSPAEVDRFLSLLLDHARKGFR